LFALKLKKTKIQFIPYNGRENTFFQKYHRKTAASNKFFTFSTSTLKLYENEMTKWFYVIYYG